MRNVNTQVATTAARPNAFDIAVEKAGTQDKEIRADITSLDIVDNSTARVTTRLGAVYRIEANAPAAAPGRNANDLTRDQLMSFARGEGVRIGGIHYATLREYERANEAPANTGALAVVRVSPRVTCALGFTPRVAYKEQGGRRR